jgi:hypothetical protein
MHISGTAHLSAEKVNRTIATVEILTGAELKYKDADEAVYVDKFESSPDINHYSNYSKSGLLNDHVNHKPQQTVLTDTVAVSSIEPTVANSNTPDIDVSNYRNWNDPRLQEKVDILNEVFGRRAAESMRTSDPFAHARARYFDPSAPHFVGHDLDQWERDRSFSQELAYITFQQTGFVPRGGWVANPIFEGRGLGRSDGSVPRIDPVYTDRRSATVGLLMRRAVNGQLNDLFQRNGIIIPENLRLSFTIDFYHRLRVTGTDDEDLIRQIEDVLNMNGNSSRLWGHIFESLRSAHYITTAEPPSGQLSNGFERAFWLDSMLQQYTGYSLRHDLEIVDGKFLTKNGEDILELVSNLGDRHIAAYLIGELAWMINAGGPGNMPDLTLTIDFENGRLFDVGQKNGYGPGQTGWIDKLAGTMHDESLLE